MHGHQAGKLIDTAGVSHSLSPMQAVSWDWDWVGNTCTIDMYVNCLSVDVGSVCHHHEYVTAPSCIVYHHSL